MSAETSLSFEAQGHYVKVAYALPAVKAPVRAESKRGKVVSFSRASRKRLLEKCARQDLNAAIAKHPITFITLTYPKHFPDARTAKVHLFSLLKRLARLFPGASGFWRLEFQRRGAPHFHLILFNLPFLSRESLKVMWGEIIGLEFWDYSQPEPEAPRVDIRAVQNARKAMSYVSKYTAKHDDGASGQVGLLDDAYLTVNLSVGRFWGAWNAKALPWGRLITASLPHWNKSSLRILYQMRRLMARKWSGCKKSGRYKGASLFVDNVERWYYAYLWCVVQYS